MLPPLMVRFSLFGIPIEIQPWFWITLGFLGILTNDPTDAAGLLNAIMFVTAAFVSVVVHELGHALTARAFKAPTRIVLQAFGGYATFPQNFFSRGQLFAVTAAGPVIQIVLGVAFLVLDLFVELPNPAGNALIRWTWAISFFWAFLNLVPVIPLDGGQMLATLMGPARRPLALKVSIAAAVVIGIGGFLKMGMFIFPIFLGMMAHQNWQELKLYQRR